MSNRQFRLAVITSHPIQYNAPLFRALAASDRLQIHVYYGWRGAAEEGAFDPEFGQSIQWDVPLFSGYIYSFVDNWSTNPGIHRFSGLKSRSLVSEVLSWCPDAVLIYGWNYRSHLDAMRSLKGRVPVLFRGDSTLLDEQSGLRRGLRRLFLRWVYRNVDTALAVGTNNHEYFLAHGLSERQIVTVPHAVDHSLFVDRDGKHEAQARSWRSELGISDGSCAVLYAGKLIRKKAPDVLIDAFTRAAIPRAHLIFAGSGDEEESLRRYSAGKANIHFLGFQNQSRMPVVYRLGDVFALPSRGPGETWGLAVNEAMASGRPALVSDRVGCGIDLVVDGRTGRIFPNEDVETLASVLREYLSNPNRLRTMGDAAFQHIQDWSMDRQASLLEDAVRMTAERFGEAPLTDGSQPACTAEIIDARVPVERGA